MLYYFSYNVPSTACSNETDRFSVSSSVAHLNYPVGLLTADEIVMAGASGNSNSSNTSYYLYTGDFYFVMSLSQIENIGISMLALSSEGDIQARFASSSYALRPVVSLKPGIEFLEGGNGTPTKPYVVKYD